MSFRSSAPPSGKTWQESEDNNNETYYTNEQSNRTDPNATSQATLVGGGWDSTQTDDIVFGSYVNGTTTLSSITLFTQQGGSSGNVSAGGNQWDGAGHTGRWTYTAALPVQKPRPRSIPGRNGTSCQDPWLSMSGAFLRIASYGAVEFLRRGTCPSRTQNGIGKTTFRPQSESTISTVRRDARGSGSRPVSA